jgi:thiol-disulfide isomerase/thioredoxin
MAKKTPEKKTPDSSGGSDQAVLWTSLGVVALLVGGFVFLNRAKAPAPAPAPQPGASVEAPAPAAQQAPGAIQVAAKAKSQDSSRPPAPDFSLTNVMDGKPFRLSDQKGKVVLIDFWATWCGPCRMAIPHLIELQKEYKGKGLQVVGVSLDQQGPAVVKPFYQQWKMNYTVVIDDQGAAARDYGGIRSIPTAILVGRDGRIVTGFVGYRPKEEYENAIKAALAKG